MFVSMQTQNKSSNARYLQYITVILMRSKVQMAERKSNEGKFDGKFSK